MVRVRWVGPLVLALALVPACACAGVMWVLADGADPAQYPGSTLISQNDLPVASVLKGYLSRDGAYQTADRFPTVWRWYSTNFGLGANRVVYALQNCMTLAKDEYGMLSREVMGVTLCDQPDGSTMIFVSRTIFIIP